VLATQNDMVVESSIFMLVTYREGQGNLAAV
jgi:hypothetical protein